MDLPQIIHPWGWPPEQLDLWDGSFAREFSGWKRRDMNRSNMNKDEFRQYIIKLNTEYNFEEIYDNIEIGLEAFENLNKFIPRFPKYDLNADLETLYSDKNDVRVKDFIKLGADFVMSLDAIELSQFDTSTTASSHVDSFINTNEHSTPVQQNVKEMGISNVGEDLKTNSQECPSVPALPACSHTSSTRHPSPHTHQSQMYQDWSLGAGEEVLSQEG
jgi:hypothetical protein